MPCNKGTQVCLEHKIIVITMILYLKTIVYHHNDMLNAIDDYDNLMPID